MSLNHAELIAIGTELLDPWHLDTNGAYLIRQLGTIGIVVRFRTVVGDDPDDLTNVFRIALGRSDLIIATGGLGPTIDDRTRETVAALLGRPLEERAVIVADLETRYAQIGLALSQGARRQASVPRDAEVLPNHRGSAPGLLIREGKATIVLLPGVPAEMREMVVDSLLTRLASGSTRVAYRTLLIAGLTESEVDQRLDPVAKNAAGIGWTILASPGQVSIHLSEPVKGGEEATRIAVTETEIRRILGDRLFAVDNETMEGVVGRMLHASGGTLAVAESMTGGGVARAITTVPGSSRYFVGGVVCYSDRVKRQEVGVRPETLDRHGAVSAEVAEEMAAGIRDRLGSHWGLSVTGYAGPETGSGHPPGQVFVGLSGAGKPRAESFSFPGDRDAVRLRAVRGSLDLLRRTLLDESG